MRDRVMTDVQSLLAQMLHLQSVLKKFTKRILLRQIYKSWQADSSLLPGSQDVRPTERKLYVATVVIWNQK